MEAPKKIYLSEFTDTTEAVFYVKQDNAKETDIEYTRTDAFIEKACKWLKFNYAEFTDNTRLGIKIDELINDFKKDMEG